MSDPNELSLSEVNRKRGLTGGAAQGSPSAAGVQSGNAPHNPVPASEPVSTSVPRAAPDLPEGESSDEGRESGFSLPFDPLRLWVALMNRWKWVVAGAAAGGLLAIIAGIVLFRAQHIVTVQFVRQDPSAGFRTSDIGEAFKPNSISTPTLMAMMRSPSVLDKTVQACNPSISSFQLDDGLTISSERGNEMVVVRLVTRASAAKASALINAYVTNVLAEVREAQAQEADRMSRFFREQLTRIDDELVGVNKEIKTFSSEQGYFNMEYELPAYLRQVADVDLEYEKALLQNQDIEARISTLKSEVMRQNPLYTKLASARQSLEVLLTRYTDANPLVQEQMEIVAGIEKQVAKLSTNTLLIPDPGDNRANALYQEYLLLTAQHESTLRHVEQVKTSGDTIRTKVSGLPEKANQFTRLRLRQKTLESTRSLLDGRQREAQVYTEKPPELFRVLSLTKPEDVRRSMGMQKLLVAILAGIGAGAVGVMLVIMGIEAFDNRLISSADLSRSARLPVLLRMGDLAQMTPEALELWRYRAWSVLLHHLSVPGSSSLICGLVSARPGTGRSTWLELLGRSALDRQWRVITIGNRDPQMEPLSRRTLAEGLEKPEALLAEMNSGRVPMMHLSWDADWTWTPERRAALGRFLKVCSEQRQLLVLLEMPPLDRLDAAMVAEQIPRLLWLSSSGLEREPEVAELAATLRSGGSHLCGAILNREPAVFARLPDLSRIGLALALGAGLLSGQCPAQVEEDAAPGPTNGPMLYLTSCERPARLAEWQERFTLGPGDTVDLQVYGQPLLTMKSVAVGPDGKISFHQARNVQASGRTIDELRESFDAAMAVYYKNARVIVIPVAIQSKKYHLMGSVLHRDTYTLDRPTTLLEAIARGQGVALGMRDYNVVEIADLGRAFIVRKGRRLPVDFALLLQEGDLRQNILLEPEDYIYLPSSVVNEAFILGAIATPGTMEVSAQTTLIRAIAIRGGFLSSAYKQRILIVRGSLKKPETIVINVADILAAKAVDFKIMPRDIVYVADRPWLRAEELLDHAITSFVEGAAAYWAGGTLSPVLSSPTSQ
jgi:protein involved in polysaccharide export with SLBB domain/capsular polysaccharide biosynthesis protein